MKFHAYKNKVVRDLAWSIGSPVLMVHEDHFGREWPARQLEKHEEWLQQLDEDPEPLLTFLTGEGSTGRLGVYFEQLLYFWWQHSPYFQVLLHGEQVYDHAKTVGELDFIIRDEQANAVIHIETAVKYYLGYRNSDNWENWIGPNSKDTLAKKMDKLQGHQLRLSASEPGKKLLEQHGIDVDKRLVLLKGWLFYQYGHASKAPDGVQEDHLKGYWCYWSQFGQDIDRHKSNCWKILPRKEWLSPEKETNSGKLMSYNDLCHHLDSIEQRPLMLVHLEKGKNNFEETERWMVVPEQWPGLLL